MVAGETQQSELSYQLVATDLDGTLLGPDGLLSARTLRAARGLFELGVPLVLATARRLTGAAKVASALGIPVTLILYDGALTLPWQGGADAVRDSLSADIAQQAVEVLAAHCLQPIVQYYDPRGESLLIGPQLLHSHDADQYISLYSSQVTELPVAELCRHHGDPLRVVAFGEHERLQAAARDISALPCGWQFLPIGNYGSSELTVFSSTASKANALTVLAAQLGIPLAQVMAVGDGINDVEMVRIAGLGVAMANGGQATQRVAQVIAPPNSADGAAWAFERYVLGWDDVAASPSDEADARAS